MSGNNAGQDGGGIYNFSGAVNSFNSTITDNLSDADLNGTGVGGGVHNNDEVNATFIFQNTILAGNFETQRSGNGFVATIGECDGTIISGGNNLMKNYDTSHCTVIGNPLLADPRLSPLQNNGGPTQTHALLAGSPAVDAGNPNGCLDSTGALLQTDQRGLLRAADGNGDGRAVCDIGAFELSGQNVIPVISVSDITITEGNSRTVNATFQLSLSAPSSQHLTVTFSTSDSTAAGGTDYVSTSGTVTFNPGENSKTITVVVNGDTTNEPDESFFLNLSNPMNATIADGQGMGTIINDDSVERLSNISTRGAVLPGDNAMIGGFIIDGPVPKRVLVRSRGPSVSGAPFSVPGTLANPLIRLFSGPTMIAQNDNWQDPPNCPGFTCEGAIEISKTGLAPCQPQS